MQSLAKDDLGMTTNLQAAVIIPHYNDVTRLLTCLSALGQIPEHIECVVVDNDSSVDLGPVREKYPTIRILTEPLSGAAMARNRGVAETTAPLLFFLDCDCVPAAGWIEAALRVADRADVIGGHISVFDETPPPRTGAQGFEAVFAFNNAAYIRDKGFSVTANLVTKRDVFEANGPFRTGVSEDLDWCRRAVSKRYSLVYAPDLKVAHPSRGDWTALKRKWRRLTAEAFGVHGDSGFKRLAWAARGMLMPFTAVVHLPLVLRSPALSGVGEQINTVSTLVRLRGLRGFWMLKQALGWSL